MFLLLLWILLTLGISFWNARAVGQVWAESKAIGGWIRIVTWAGAIQSAIGFTAVYGVLVVMGAAQFGLLPAAYVLKAMNLLYILIIIPALSSGYIITIHSWIAFAREKSLANGGVAAWNTFSSIYNTYQAIDGFGDALSSASSLFDASGDDDDAAAIAIALILFALFAGVLTTTAIVKKYAGTLPIPECIEVSS